MFRQTNRRSGRGLLHAAVLFLVLLTFITSLRPTAPVAAAYPGLNGKIVFSSYRTGNGDLYTMNPDGSDLQQLTNSPSLEQGAVWSPDGARIAFSTGENSIYVMDADGNNVRLVTSNGEWPTWSPDGTKLAFMRCRSCDDIWVINVDGSGETQLTNHPEREMWPKWSPDGTKIAYHRQVDYWNDEIYVMNADGTNQTRLTDNPAADYYPGWSPDGKRIVFTSTRDPDGEIFLMNADGTGVVPLTNNTYYDQGAAWSPDGTHITWECYPDGNNDICTVNTDGSDIQRLTDNVNPDFAPDWQPLPAVFASTTTAGTVGALAFGPHDILMWDGAVWTKWFDGTAAGLVPAGLAKHNIDAIWVPDPLGEDVLLSFTQNARFVPGIDGLVHGMDLVWWDGASFSLYFDGQDVGLTNLTQEKIDALHVLDGSLSPIGGNCLAYLLISTQGPGQVPAYGGGQIRFSGEDVLGFCMTNQGQATAGLWHLMLDGSAEGMPRNSLDGLSAAAGGNVLYLTTKGAFIVDSASGGHSMVYRYDWATAEFSGPYFSAPSSGLTPKLDALQVQGLLP